MKFNKATFPSLLGPDLSRRRFVTGLAGGSALMGVHPNLLLAQQAPAAQPEILQGTNFDLEIGYTPVNISGVQSSATTINGRLPAPLLRWREGDNVTLRVRNNLAEDSSIHWHGIILPSGMDGVPGLSFNGIRPGETFEYRFQVQQNGTFWYHSHSGFQEQTGLYGPLVIDPVEPEPFSYDREYVVMLSDWSDTPPDSIYSNLKKMSHYYNFNERTLADIFNEVRDKGMARTWNDRAMWNQMRMTDRDISDVTAYTYTYLMNGVAPDPGWLGLFANGERIRLRFINSSAMTIFDVRIPGLRMSVVAADGQYIEPVTVDDFRIGVAETYDVIIEPDSDEAYSVFAQSIDRSGYALGTLTPDASLRPDVPAMDPTPVLGMQDMGMSMENMNMPGMNMSDDMPGMNMPMNSAEDMPADSMPGMNMPMNSAEDMPADSMPGMNMPMNSAEGMPADSMPAMNAGETPAQSMNGMMQPAMNMANSGMAGYGSNAPIRHVASEFGPGVDMRSENPQSGLNDPGIGLRDHQWLYGRRVLTYGDLKNLGETLDPREPGREIQLHLTGNMHRYMWSFNGIPYADAEPIHLDYGERVRITLVNDTMMTHPIHLHGMWSELETGDPDHIPRKHTVMVQPGSRISYLVTADAMGSWAYHCHLLYHMMGMFREVEVS